MTIKCSLGSFPPAEIAADTDGKAEYQNVIARLEKKKVAAMKRIKDNEDWINAVQSNLGPFLDKYAQLCKDIEVLYGQAKEKHAAGLELLKNEFDYHAEYKRWNDRFTAIPFRPA